MSQNVRSRRLSAPEVPGFVDEKLSTPPLTKRSCQKWPEKVQYWYALFGIPRAGEYGPHRSAGS